MNKDEAQIRSLLDEFTGAIHDKDAAAAVALLAKDGSRLGKDQSIRFRATSKSPLVVTWPTLMVCSI
jgi:hypothetical protein